jgi:tRNA (cmo5U34)-methyltransferase
MAGSEYRWNQQQAVTAYDAAAPVIHPRYVAVQDQLLSAIPLNREGSFRAVDLGGGSGRLAERILRAYPAASIIVIDQSEAFLALAKERLAPFDGRAACLHRRLQDDWHTDTGPVDLIVSTSAIHHLEGSEKQALFDRCYEALSPRGVLINGDEYRPEDDESFLAMLHDWGRHMDRSLAAGAIPASFGPTIESWKKRNLDGFGAVPKSGDDCQETVEAQLGRLQASGFSNVRAIWSDALWAVLVAAKV